MALLDTEKTNETQRFINWECPYRSWKMVNELTGEVQDFDCKSWRCMKHGPINAWRWGIRAGAIPWDIMVTFTKVPDERLQARKHWQATMRYLRNCGITGFLKVMELGPQNGMRHYHVLLVGARWVNLPRLNAIAVRHGAGFTWATKVKDKGRATRYLLKYALKDLGAGSHRFRGWRTVTASRSVPSWKDVTRKRLGETFVEEGWMLCR